MWWFGNDGSCTITATSGGTKWSIITRYFEHGGCRIQYHRDKSDELYQQKDADLSQMTRDIAKFGLICEQKKCS